MCEAASSHASEANASYKQEGRYFENGPCILQILKAC